MLGDPGLAARLRATLALPVIVGPMFLVSGPELVIACCQSRVAGSFPTLNARSTDILDQWLTSVTAALDESAAPYAANLIVHPTNPRLADDLGVIVKHKVPLVIASVGSPVRVVADVKGYGGLVFADVASLKHARRAAEVGVDGLILLCAGSGGHTGWLNPFAFVTAVRKFFAGPVVVAGSISNGRMIHVAEELGADFAYLGTPFIAATESLAGDDYRQMLVDSDADDIQLMSELTGMPANMLRKSVERSKFKPEATQGAFDAAKGTETLRAWRDIWSAGHGVGDIERIEPVAAIVDHMIQEYRQARMASQQRLAGVAATYETCALVGVARCS
ncbi:nitronate monooxygenase [Sphingomonas populi]|uniref:Nitronate monooxygenase n=1 Tax=Sphingomonas populi TaxID=2484750 RepID=A0A4Q6XGY1_9SPHN|nr:nitronate monooxygenase [Sphingomonas populi]RZF59151.1 nitronate monooxygenase [Sphingomonas populi]